ncbi:MAG: hypothetical protein IKI64_05555 [Clostridia bacterium]|nr:hypothetical protein [Clostridia bacterium]
MFAERAQSQRFSGMRYAGEVTPCIGRILPFSAFKLFPKIAAKASRHSKHTPLTTRTSFKKVKSGLKMQNNVNKRK